MLFRGSFSLKQQCYPNSRNIKILSACFIQKVNNNKMTLIVSTSILKVNGMRNDYN